MPKSVLIVEDSKTQAALIAKLFTSVDYAPTVVHDQASAQTHLRSRRWDLVVLDVYVAGGNTLDSMDVYRSLAPVTPIAVMTAGRADDPLSTSAALNKARRDKANFLLAKPFNLEDVQQICRDVSDMAERRDRNRQLREANLL